ncbi:uncharacterized protein LOC119066924 isoform X1 [Bradysia coprophila]|uniref:uncharacterized protein LOC119066924 isoform X1 n=1 Tax=Bradysia coprophila TaxID=38358 RepID=UPI00187D96A5|nr:uncharacterized protein LOC119066924 isoform X1 [Bradysia coprophila]
MLIILKMCIAVFMALLVAASVESAATGITPGPVTQEPVTREIDGQSVAQTHSLPPAPTRLTTTAKPVKICDVTYSCGWGIYTQTPFKRELNYFMKNSCECPEGEHCVRVDDDTALSAYIYKCRVKRTTPAPPTEEDE